MTRRLPSLKALRAFEAAARHQSFTRAAAELFVTHAAISRHVRELEDWLGLELFRRTGRGVVLSESGRQLSIRLTPLFDGLADAVRELVADASGAALSVSVEPALATRWLVPRLGRFTALHPEIELNLDPSAELVNFRSGAAELAIRYGEGGWEDVEEELLIRLVVFPVASPDLLRRSPLAGPDDLRHVALLHEESKQWWQEWLEAAGATKVNARRGPQFQGHLAIEAAEAGQGVALADSVLALDALEEGWLVRPFSIDLPQGAYYLIRPPGMAESPAARAFRLWVRQEMAETGARFERLLAAGSSRSTAPSAPG